MARKRNVKTEEPEEVDHSDEGVNNSTADENSGSGHGRRVSARARTIKKPYKGDSSFEDEDEDGLSEEEEKPKRRGRAPGGGGRGRGRPAAPKGKPPAKKSKKDDDESESEEVDDSEDDEEGDGEESEGDAANTPAEFRSGCFVVLRSDIDNSESDHPIWKIDGKSLLQKFDRFQHNDQTLFKGTTIYAGWSQAVINTYYPIKVEYIRVEGVDSAVKFDPTKINKKDFVIEGLNNTATSEAEGTQDEITEE